VKQILQDISGGLTDLVEVPCIQVKSGCLLIRTSSSIISMGTEKMLVDFGQANLFEKARQQPEKVKQVLDKIRTDGLQPTYNAVRTKLDQPIPLGYSNAGVVIAVGKDVRGFSVGDRVVSNGYHAEVVHVPQNLCSNIPDNVSDESAAFTVLAAIGLQGIRLAQPSLGESFVVTGLGLIGLLTVQLLVAQGCRVLGIDFDSNRLKLAKQFGAEVVDLSKGEDPIEVAMQFSKGRGVDGVLISATTKSNEPVHQAAQMCRKRGRIVLIGVTGLELSRADFYEKELSFQVSCSYGPGRYDPSYEDKGQDYPFGLVRWTEQRNFEAILDMISRKSIDMAAMISHRFSFDRAEEAYQLLSNGEPSLGIVLNYPTDNLSTDDLTKHTIQISKNTNKSDTSVDSVVVGMIGAGNFTNQILLPAIKNTEVHLKSIASSGGIHGVHVGKRFGFKETTTDSDAIIKDQQINTVFITTRHDSHARYVAQAIHAGKHVFVEKPLCLNKIELDELQQLSSNNILMVGFNRRFAPHSKKIKELLSSVKEPKTMIMTVNAGMISTDHWTQDPEVGGGRIIGEACHFVDLLRFLVGHPIIDIKASMVGVSPGVQITDDKISITLSFSDGSIGTIHYFANGHKSFPKERLEVFTAGRILALDNFKVLTGYGWPRFKKMKLWNQDKGHHDAVKAFIDAIKHNKSNPIPLEEIFEVTRACFDIIDAVKSKN